jgi:hypothetical protein
MTTFASKFSISLNSILLILISQSRIVQHQQKARKTLLLFLIYFHFFIFSCRAVETPALLRRLLPSLITLAAPARM